jgi:DNA-binding transcriptional ArsR family regulator
MSKRSGHSGRSERWLSHPAALRTLASVTRQEMVDVLTSTGPLSVAELAALLGRRPDALYFHARALQRAGLLAERDNRRTGGRMAAVYGVPCPIRLDYSAGSRPALARVVRQAVRLALREFERACVSGQAAGRRGARSLWGGRVMGWVTPSGLRRANALIAELHTLLRAGRPGRARRAVSLGFLLAPASFGERVRRENRKEIR